MEARLLVCHHMGKSDPRQVPRVLLARVFHELASRDREDGLATWQPQELEPEAYLNNTSQGLRQKIRPRKNPIILNECRVS